MHKRFLFLYFVLQAAIARAQEQGPEQQIGRPVSLGILINAGVSTNFMNTRALDLWGLQHGRTTSNYGPSGNISMLLQVNRIAVGGFMDLGSRVQQFNGTIARELFRRGDYGSLLGVCVGYTTFSYPAVEIAGFTYRDGLTYTDYYLHSGVTTIGLTSRQVFTVRRKHGSDDMNMQFFATASYALRDARWEYGYDNDDHKYFSSRISGVPSPGRFILSTGISLGIGGANRGRDPRKISYRR